MICDHRDDHSWCISWEVASQRSLRISSWKETKKIINLIVLKYCFVFLCLKKVRFTPVVSRLEYIFICFSKCTAFLRVTLAKPWKKHPSLEFFGSTWRDYNFTILYVYKTTSEWFVSKLHLQCLRRIKDQMDCARTEVCLNIKAYQDS